MYPSAESTCFNTFLVPSCYHAIGNTGLECPQTSVHTRACGNTGARASLGSLPVVPLM